jgi:sugar/nucleoside kinase (ribokinase family)
VSQPLANTRYDVVSIGNYTKDTIVSAAGTRQIDGGGFNYAACAAAALGLKVAAVTRLASEDDRVVDALEQAGIVVYAERTPSSTLMRLEYPTDNVDERILTVAATAGSFTPAQVQAIDGKAFVISPSIRGEVPLEVIQELRQKDATVGADVQGFIRIREADGRLEHREWPQSCDVLPMIDILKTDAVEAASLTGETEISAAARRLAELGPREIVLTHRNGLLVHAEGRFHEVEFHPKTLVGRSGRGDTCLGAYVASRLTRTVADATIWAAAITSLKMEAEGPFRGGMDDIVQLIEKAYTKTE